MTSLQFSPTAGRMFAGTLCYSNLGLWHSRIHAPWTEDSTAKVHPKKIDSKGLFCYIKLWTQHFYAILNV